MSKWKEIKTPINRPENAACLEPFPAGPYLIVSQFEQEAFLNMSLTRAKEEFRNKLHTDLPTYTLGKVAFCFEDGFAKKCFYHYDTSD